MEENNNNISSDIPYVKKPGNSHLYKIIQNYNRHKFLFILFVPTLIFFIVFHYLPMYGVIIAFKDYRFNEGIWGSPWVGLQYFKMMFEGIGFTSVFKNTIIISSLKLIFGFPAPIILALLLNELRGGKFKRTVQTISYLPHFLSWVILAGILKQFLSPSIGPIGHIMNFLGLRPIYFLQDSEWFRSVLVGTSLWKGVGWGTIVYLAGIASINFELYEAAIVDGAGRFRRAVHITLPSLVPIVTFMFILSVGSLISDDFDQILNLLNPAVEQVGDVISTYTYRIGLVMMEYSYSAAVGLFRNIIAIILILATNFIIKKMSDNEYSIL